MSGPLIAAEIAAAYGEVGEAAGDGGALIIQIKRRGAPTGTSDNPIPGPFVLHSFTAKPDDQKYTRRSGTPLAEGEHVFSLVNHEVTAEPKVTDVLLVNERELQITEVIEMNPGGFVLTWMVKASG